MPSKITVDSKELDGMLRNFEAFVEKSVPDLVRKYARLAAVELANRTQPFSVGAGAGAKAKKDGENAIENDIHKIIPSHIRFQAIVDATTSESLRKRLQGYLSSNNMTAFGTILKNVGMFKDFEVISKSQLPGVHKDHRSSRTGRTSSKQKTLLTSASVSAYIKKVQKKVGMGKAGWADCARKIGGLAGDGARGIPAFAKAARHGSYGSVTMKLKGENPSVRMTNEIPWSSRICDDRQQKMALDIARDKMAKEMDKRIRAAAKTNFDPLNDE
jgi:hypothetical protein